jgi:N-hydroxyarylamine O-acetyltransferase
MDLDAYRARIGHDAALRPDLATLRTLHLAHASTIPFENLDIQMGLPISLDLPALEDKLVRRRRGGYCFEQNTLFLAVLREIGFDVAPFEARVRQGTTEIRPRTHMLLRVRLAGDDQLADVGFGGQGLLEPLPMDATVHEQFGDAYRVLPEGPQRILQWRTPEGWTDLYAFVPEERPAVDFVMGNHFTSTHPRSPFVKTLTVQLPTPEARYVLRDRAYAVTRRGQLEERTVQPDELRPLLRERFGLDIADTAPLRLPWV